MSAIIPAPAQDWHKLFKIAPLVIILLYMRTQPEKPVTQIGLSEEFGIDRKTAAGCLRQLASNGMVALVDRNNGYMLADGGMQTLLDFDAGWGKNGHLPLKESFKDLKDLRIKEKKERKNQVGKKWTSPEGLTTERILSETGKLFGFETISHGISDRDPSHAMCLIAHAYDQRERLSKPQVFVYRRLQKNEPSDKKYQADPLSFLPNDFLHALGLADLAVVDVAAEDDEIFPAGNETESEAAQLLKELCLAEPQIRAAAPAWQALSLDGQYLTLGADALKCDVYADRFSSTINRLLVGLVDDTVRVRFVVSTETEG